MLNLSIYVILLVINLPVITLFVILSLFANDNFPYLSMLSSRWLLVFNMLYGIIRYAIWQQISMQVLMFYRWILYFAFFFFCLKIIPYVPFLEYVSLNMLLFMKLQINIVHLFLHSLHSICSNNKIFCMSGNLKIITQTL